MQSLFVPVDGSETSWRAVDVAISLARKCDTPIHVVEVVFAPRDIAAAQQRMDEALGERDSTELTIDMRAEAFDGTPAAAISHLIKEHPAATIVMASHGRGRSAALLGSVTEDVLERTFGPVLVVGPHVDVHRFEGPVVVPVDGSDESEASIPLAVAWATELGVPCWIVHMSDRGTQSTSDLTDTAYVSRLARDIATTTGHTVEFDELHGNDPVHAVADYAERLGAGLIVATTHARTGWSRLTSGSVSSGFVRDAVCPVLEHRLPRAAASGRTTAKTHPAVSG